MVKNTLAKVEQFEQEIAIEDAENDIKWCTVSLLDVVEHGKRLEASVFDVEAKKALETIKNCKWNTKKLITDDKKGFVKRAYYGARLKRNYINKYRKDAIGFIGSSEMLDIDPKPVKFMSKNDKKTNDLMVKENDILVSRSGTVGKIAYVNKTISKLLISEHAIRLECNEYPGYIYTYLKSKIGQLIIKSKQYGAVVQEIEPEHLAEIPIPDASVEIKQKIDKIIKEEQNLLDESNKLIDEAKHILIENLKFPPFENLCSEDNEINTFSLKLSEIDNRLDASYHLPIVDKIFAYMKENAREIITIGSPKISKNIILPGRFKRVFVSEENGVKFLGSKVMNQLDPSTEKFISKSIHKKALDNILGIKKNSILLAARGTIGEVVLPPKHFEGWAISDNMMQLISYEDICGYVYIFLSTDYGKTLIKKFVYGGVVDAIEPEHIRKIPIPLLENEMVQKKINDLALQANKLRYESYCLEQEAIQIMNKEVIYAK